MEMASPGESGAIVLSPQPVPPVSHDDKGGDLVVAPIPTHDPTQGWGLQLIGQYIFKSPDQASSTPPSVAAAGGFYTEEKSFGFFGGYLGHWKDDLWRPIFAAGYLHLNYDFYGIGNADASLGVALPIQQDITFGFTQVMRRIRPNFYGGLRVAAATIKTETTGIEQPPITIPAFEHDLNSLTVGPIVQWDSRDDQFYPTTGTYATIAAMFVGGDREYQIYRAEWNYYTTLGERQVLAVRAMARTTAGDAPFYALSQFGMGSDLRGYTTGKYRDKAMVATQAEYRRELTQRWGFVVFAGVGEVMPALNEINTDDLLPSFGAGLRFRVSKEHPVNLRLDYAYGKDGGTGYLQVNEAF